VCPENVSRFGSQLGRSVLTNRTEGSGRVSVSSVTSWLLTLSSVTMVWRPMRVGLVSCEAGEWTACFGDYIMCTQEALAQELAPEAAGRRGKVDMSTKEPVPRAAWLDLSHHAGRS